MSRTAHEAAAEEPTTPRRNPITVGSVVFAVLIFLTILEYLVFLWLDRNLPIMIAMNVADAALIMVYFMHLPRVWRGEEDE
jgi:heme/copper-type cytochrome/quinol oxidase subunit 4